MTEAVCRADTAADQPAMLLRPASNVAVAIAATSAFAAPAPVEGAHRPASLTTSRATESHAARALLRWLLAREIGPHAAAATIAARPGGQPYLSGLADVGISLSHSHGHLAVAAGTGVVVGVDVQAPVATSWPTIRRCCLPPVRDRLAALPSVARNLEFAWIWTIQEACVKAAGMGLAGRPWSIPVEWGQWRGEWLGHRWTRLHAGTVVPVSVAYGAGGG